MWIRPILDRSALSIAATGGYGRGVLAPFGDVDLLFLTAEQPARTLQVVDIMLYFLWDLELKVGHATRSIEDCRSEAPRTTIMRRTDARHPDRRQGPLFADFHRRFRTACKEAGAASILPPNRASALCGIAAMATAVRGGTGAHQERPRRPARLRTVADRAVCVDTQTMGEPRRPGRYLVARWRLAMVAAPEISWIR